LKVASLILGVLAICGMFLGLIPFLGWLNWFVIPFAGIGLLVSIIAVVTSQEDRGMGIAGIVLYSIALFISIPRLIIGGGIF
jgi:hypothetical protein